MAKKDYGKCRLCKFCVHSDDDWACMLLNKVTSPQRSCPRFRPGCCENCTHAEIVFGEATCALTKKKVDVLDVCNDFDPCGRRSL